VPNIPETIRICFRPRSEATPPPRPASEEGDLLCTRAALLHEDGTVQFIVDPDAPYTCLCELDETASYYIVIEHYNHLYIMSPDPILVVNGKISFDFRVNDSYNPLPIPPYVGQKQMLPGKFAMHGANGYQIGAGIQDINAADATTWQQDNNTIGLYKDGDYNLNGDVNYNDRKVWELNNGKQTTITRD